MSTNLCVDQGSGGAQLLAVRPRSGVHCNLTFGYHFTCPNCGHDFCSGCYDVAMQPLGAVRCRACHQVIYLASAGPDMPLGN